MITVEDLLQAYAYAYDAWIDPETERKNPIPEYAEFIRRSVSWENAKLRKLVRKVLQFERAGCEGCPYASTCDADCLYDPDCPMREDIERDMRELGVEVEQ